MITPIAIVAIFSLVQDQDLSLVETARIGALEGERAEEFGRIVDLSADAQGRVYVLDAHSSEVRVFSSGGSHLHTIGRSGPGPGEFATPRMVDARRGRVTVYDHDGRISVFSQAGELIATYPALWGAHHGRVLNDGSQMLLKDGSVTAREVHQEEVVLWMHDDSVDTLKTVPSASLFFRGPVGNAALVSPLCANVHVSLGADEKLYVADGVGGHLEEWRRRGEDWEMARSLPITAPAKPLSKERKQQLLERVPDQLDPEKGTLITTPVESSICGLILEDSGPLWVRIAADDERELWQKVDRKSMTISASLRAPPGVQIGAFAGQKAFGIWKDGLGVQYVLIYRVEE